VVIRDLDSVAPPTAALSVLSLGELQAGVRLARDPSIRATRQSRLVAIRNAFVPLPVDEEVAEHYGEVLAVARAAGRLTEATDLLIIATAAATGRTLWTLDQRQANLARAVGVAVQGPDDNS
jgi:predicted nucleic acid-binding protein